VIKEDAINGQRQPTGHGLLSAGSALAFGLLGWVTAHELSSWMFDHAHIAGSAPNAWNLDHHAGIAALLFSCLAIGSLLALLAAPSTQAQPRTASATRLPVVLSIGGFIATDFAERAVAGQHGLPPLLVLLIGASVYALIGAGSSLLWRSFVGLRLRALAPADEPARIHVVRRHEVGTRLAGFPARHWMPASAGRAPPIAVR
jgi:hypothetical protein